MTLIYSFVIAILLVQTSITRVDGCSNNSECGEGGACNLGTCVCAFGTYGAACNETCERDVDCNGGTCTHGKVCDCPLLQTGKQCENTNECDISFTCGNGLECDQSSEPYRCVEPVVTNPSTAVTITASSPESSSSGTTRNIASTIAVQLFILGMISSY